MAPRGHGIVQTLKKPGGGVDECFFLGYALSIKKCRLLYIPQHFTIMLITQ